MVQATTISLHGRRLLLVEDEYLIAVEVADLLAAAGAEVLGPVASVQAALQLVMAEAGRIDGAVLDINLRGQKVWPVVDALQARGIPVLLTSGYDASAIPGAYARLPRCEKPVSPRELTHALAQLWSSPAP